MPPKAQERDAFELFQAHFDQQLVTVHTPTAHRTGAGLAARWATTAWRR